MADICRMRGIQSAGGNDLGIGQDDIKPPWMAQEQVVQRYGHLVQLIANTVCKRVPSNVDRDDIVSEGMIGLLKAIRTFKPAYGVPFEKYCRFRILGSIRDYCRKECGIPRSVIKKHKADPALEMPVLHDPPPEEIAIEDILTVRDFVCAKPLKKFGRKNAKRLERIFMLYHIDGYSMPEIGAMEGVTMSRISQLLKVAETHLRWRYEQTE